MSMWWCFLWQLLSHHVVTELMMIDLLMNNMMERISEPCCTVRMLALRGLGNIALGSPEKVRPHPLTAGRNVELPFLSEESLFKIFYELLVPLFYMTGP